MTPRRSGPEHVAAAGAIGLLSTLTSEITSALLPALVVVTLAASVEVLGFIEGAADAVSGVARLIGAELAARRARHREIAVAGLPLAGILAGLVGAATSPFGAAALRSASRAMAEFRDPADAELLEEIRHHHGSDRPLRAAAIGQAAAQILGPLGALALFMVFASVPHAIIVGAVPALLATGVAASIATRTPRHEHYEKAQGLAMRRVVTRQTRELLIAIAAFEFGNVATTLLVLRSIALLKPGHGITHAVEISIAMYALFNGVEVLTGWITRTWKRIPATASLGVGVALFLLAYFGFAVATPSIPFITLCFVLGGAGLGSVHGGEELALCARVEEEHREAAVGVIAVIQTVANTAASAVTGLIWATIGVRPAMIYLTAWMVVSLVGLAAAQRIRA